MASRAADQNATAVEVVAVDHELADAAAVVGHGRSELMRSRTTWWAWSWVRAMAPSR